MSLVFMIPLMPEVRDGRACENSNQDNCKSPRGLEDDGSGEDTLNRWFREYASVEEEKGHLHYWQCRELGNFAPVKES